MSSVVDVQLRADRSLLNAKFESYKLSLQQLAVYPVDLGCEIHIVSVADNEFSYSRIKTVSMHNNLHGDPFNERDCYFIDKNGHVRRLSVVIETCVETPCSVFQLAPTFMQNLEKIPPTLSFPSKDRCLIADGAGLVYLLDTGDRTSDGNKNYTWKEMYSCQLVGTSSSPCMILRSDQYYNSRNFGDLTHGREYLDVLTLRFEDEKNDISVSTVAILEWTVLTESETRGKYEIESLRTFKGKNVPFYAAFGGKGADLVLGSSTPFKFIPDWNQELMNDEAELNGKQDETKKNVAEKISDPVYEWSQSSEDVTVYFPLPEGTDKKSIVYSLSRDKISIGFRRQGGDVDVALQGQLFADSDPESSVWSIVNSKLEVTIQKQIENQTWLGVVVGDTRGRRLEGNEEPPPAMNADPDADVRMQPIGLEHSEECDELPDIESILCRFDSSENKFTHEASVASHQWLFNCVHQGRYCTVLRHDVDALVWESNSPDEMSPCPWHHVATFNALGYVQASKTNIKYSGCSPNASYAALCENERRIFVYHSPTQTLSSLRNRNTGSVITSVSKQQVVSLPSIDNIIGFHSTTEHLYVLTAAKLYIIHVTTPSQ